MNIQMYALKLFHGGNGAEAHTWYYQQQKSVTLKKHDSNIRKVSLHKKIYSTDCVA